jgi:iron complex outermembrane receptor protein
MRSSCRSLLSVGLLVVTGGSLVAQGRVRGRVVDSTNVAVVGAIVSLDGTALRDVTTAQGSYSIRGVPSGTYTIRVRQIGFLPLTASLTVTSGEITRDFTLARTAVLLAPIDVIAGSRARHSAATELAVPVDVLDATKLRQVASTETSQILAELSPSVNFPRQSVSDASDIVRPFTLRGLSPDHSLVLVNGYRRHRIALVHNFAAGMAAGSSGVDMNAIPASAIDRVEILRDGAAAQYGSDAIAGVVNVVLREGAFNPYITADVGRYMTADFPDDGTTYNASGAWGFSVGRGSIGLFGEYRYRNPTNRAGADPEDQIVAGDADEIDELGNVTTKNNAVPQPNHHWGDGLAEDALGFLNARFPINAAGTSEVFAFGGYSFRQGTGNGFRRQGISGRNWPQIYPLGYLPEFAPDVIDASGAAGLRGTTASGWAWDLGGAWGYNSFDYNLRNTMNVSLGPCLTTACAPGLDGIFGNADDPGIPNKTSIFAGTLKLDELTLSANASRAVNVGLSEPANVAVGVAFRRENYQIIRGEPASYIQGGHLNRYGEPAPPGSQVFAGFQPSNEVDDGRNNIGGYVDLEGNPSPEFLVNLAGRFEHYNDFGSRVTGKAALRYQPSERVTLRGAFSTGFRAPAPSQSFYGASVTNFVLDPSTGRQRPVEVGIFPVNHPAARALGSRPLKEETSINVSAGIAVSPSDNVTLTGDYYYIRIDDRIILTSEIAGDSVAAILRNANLPVPAERGQYFTNAIDTRTQGVDLTADLRVPVGEAGTLDLGGTFNWTENKILEIREPPELDGTGTTIFDPYLSGGTIALERERPRWRTTLTAQLTRGRFRALVRNSTYARHTTTQLGACGDDCVQDIDGSTLFDVEVGYLLPGNVNISIGARNVFDTYPERLIPDNSFGIFLFPQGSPFGYNGRFVYVRSAVTLGR